MIASVTLVAVHAQEKEIPRERKEFRDKMMAERLKLTEEQQQRAKTLNENFRKQMTELRKKEDITVKEWRNQAMELNKKHREEMRNLLTNEQKDRMEKFKLERKQMTDIDADAKLEKMKLRLDLNKEQFEQLKKQRAETMEKMRSIRENNAMDMMNKRAEIRALMERRRENMKSILTEDQMKKMQELRKPMHKKRRIRS